MTRQRWFYAGIFVVALILAAVVSGFASSSPDGLEKVAADKGFIGTEQTHDLADSPLAGYGIKGIENARLSGGLAGVAGVVLTLGIGAGLFLVLRRRPTPGDPTHGEPTPGEPPTDRTPVTPAGRPGND